MLHLGFLARNEQRLRREASCWTWESIAREQQFAFLVMCSEQVVVGYKFLHEEKVHVFPQQLYLLIV